VAATTGSPPAAARHDAFHRSAIRRCNELERDAGMNEGWRHLHRDERLVLQELGRKFLSR
jgi:hypothetical protein